MREPLSGGAVNRSPAGGGPMSLSYDDIDCKASMKSKGEITADNCGLSFFLSSCNTNRQKLFCLKKHF
jgi:hypothetical protein